MTWFDVIFILLMLLPFIMLAVIALTDTGAGNGNKNFYPDGNGGGYYI